LPEHPRPEWHPIADADTIEDPYTTLGVARDASLGAIRRAYRKLAKRHHPDLNPGNAGAEARFKIIAAAHELLTDVEKRRRFDAGEIDATGDERAPAPSYRDFADRAAGRRYGPSAQASGGQASGAQASGAQASGWNADELGDIFGTMFGGGRHGGSQRTAGPRRGADQGYTLAAGFLDAVNGATQRLTLPDGRTLDVKIPPGTSDGDTLRLRGQGSAGTGEAASGDALIEIQVLPHAFFRRDGADIRLTLPVSVPEAVLGGPVEVPTPGGPVRMRIPAGSDTGTELRLRGRGVPAHGGRAAGDLFATLRVLVGKPDAALEAFLRQWIPEHQANPRHALETGR
jgi:DnaJ-class molecular chaperone